MFRPDLLPLPVHAGGTLVIDLHAVHADITLAGSRIARDDARHSNEAGGVLRPALQDGKIEQRQVVTFDDVFARAGGNRLGEELTHFRQHGQHFDFVEEALW